MPPDDSSPLAESAPAPLGIARGGGAPSGVEFVRLSRPDVSELYLVAKPGPEDMGPDFPKQVRSMYENLFRTLVEEGAAPRDVLVEKVYFCDIKAQYDTLIDIRSEFYNRYNHSRYHPSSTLIEQRPCDPRQLCELQAYAVFPSPGKEIMIKTSERMVALPDGRRISSPGKVVEIGDRKHIFISNVLGSGSDFATQARTMFEVGQSLLQEVGADFRDVVRTWIYLADIDGDYESFNRERRSFFARAGVERRPASTGIGGVPFPTELGCALDIYAILSEEPMEIVPMHTRTLNEAFEYGSDFSRGMRVVDGEKITLFISGTASVDEEGRTAHVGDPRAQIERMLLNVETLLVNQGANFADLISGITYLKRPEFVETFDEVLQSQGIPRFPNSLLVADICRPELLCEFEAIAVLPASPARH